MRFLFSLALFVFFAQAGIAQTERRDVMVVFDMSGSMWGQVDGVAKVEIARDAFGGLLEDWAVGNTPTGLIAYGHRERGNCADIETLATPDQGADIAALVAGLRPLGKTPLSDAVRQAAEVLRFTEEKATVVLLSDGVETCNADPCAVGAELEALGLDFTAHVIGFDIAEGDKAQLQCLANATGGQYFDAADAGELADAMDGVLQATAEPDEAVETPTLQDLTIRVNGPQTLRLPDDMTVYAGDTVLGTLTEATATIPGLPVSLPLGGVTLRVEGSGITGELMTDVADDTTLLVIDAQAVEADYVLFRDGQFPVLQAGSSPLANQHYVMINNTTGVDRASHYYTYLYPSGSTDAALRIRGDNIGPQAGQYNLTSVTSPTTPGDYDLVLMGTNDEEYGRIPVAFAAEITPVWQGAREVEPGAVIDAHWAGPSNRSNQFQFLPADQEASDASYGRGTGIQNMATPEGFKLTAPSEPGLYRLVFLTDVVNMRQFDTVDLGLIAVGVSLPALPDTSFDDASLELPENSMEAETAAMGGEEGELIPVGDLHGDWLLVAADYQFHPLLATQLNHEQDASDATGGIDVRATTWNFGETTGHERFDVTRDGDAMSFVANLSDNTYAGELTHDGAIWRGVMEYDANTVDSLNVILVRPEDIALLYVAANPEPTPISIVLRDERGGVVETPTEWSIIQGDAQDGEYAQTDEGRYYQEDMAPDAYFVTANSGGMTGSANFIHAMGWRRGHVVVVRPQNEGADLPIRTTFYCSPNEDCAMEMVDIPIAFDLPVGWGAERPIETSSGEVAFNMVTMTPNGPFYATLNQRQRDASLGPCTKLLTGTFCHDATDDPELLADIALIQRSLSFKPVGMWLDEERFETLLNQLIGETE